MAILKGMVKKMKGSAGEMVFRANSGRTIVSEKAASVKNVRSAAQQKTRMKWANIIQMYKAIAPHINYGFENKTQGVTDYNMFVKVNMLMPPVYLTKSDVSGGACIAAPYKMTQGSLPAIEVTGERANAITNISLGETVINASTTVGDFSVAVISGNSDFKQNDQISFFSILQYVNSVSGIPYVRVSATSVILDPQSNTPLWSLVNKAGFASKNGYLAHGADEGNGAYCWVHSRNKNGKVKVSSQALLDNNAILASYTSQDAYYEAVNTYGGESDVFLSPDGSSVTRSSASGGSSTPSGGGTSSGDDEGGSF